MIVTDKCRTVMNNILNFRVTSNIEKKKMSKSYQNVGFGASLPLLNVFYKFVVLIFVVCVPKNIINCIGH